MKKAIIAMAAAAAAAAAGAADVKIGTVDMVELVGLHPSHESNKNLVKSTNDDYKEKIEAKQDALKEIAEEGRKVYEDMQNPMLSESAKSDLRKKLDGIQQRGNAARQELLRSDQLYREQLTELETRLLKMETGDIRKKVEEYAKANGYDMVIDASMLAYSSGALDITDEILKAMKVDPEKRKTLKKDK